MARASRSEELTLDGPAGRLQALLDVAADDDPTAVVVVCHPHPQHGGTMHNKVAYTLARAFVSQGFAALRFNFRGTENSEGEYDEGVGELDDALAAATWLQSRYPDLPLWIAGFSFGAAIAVRAAVAIDVEGLVSVAPAIYRFGEGLEGQPDCPWLIVQGDEDELVAVDETVEWVNSLEPGPELLVMAGVEHFFHGNLVALREAVSAFISTHSV